jgi:hypothetical protein
MEINKKYKIRIEVKDQIFTYDCLVTAEDEHFVSFTDKFGKNWQYNKSNILSMEEIE